ncbi:MAG: glucokinase, partial [Rhodospirillales bacterium]|nr:glucokinase [Rhodospirillales bacterium]
MPAEPPALIADIGGTNARFALCDGPGRWSDERLIPCDEYPDLTAIIEAYFLDVSPRHRPKRAAIGIACPVYGDHVALTNRNWSFSIAEVQSRLGLGSLEVVNDFEAVAQGLPFLWPGDVVKFGTGQAATGYPIIAIGP